MITHYQMLDAVNDSKTQREHDIALARLEGWREGMEYSGRSWSVWDADDHTKLKYGKKRPVFTGLLLDLDLKP